jgi:hypothetical protein
VVSVANVAAINGEYPTVGQPERFIPQARGLTVGAKRQVGAAVEKQPAARSAPQAFSLTLYRILPDILFVEQK